MSDDKSYRYPLGDHHRGDIAAKSGRALGGFGVDEITAGGAGPDDLSISAETLELQARFAREAGYPEVAANLTRAAEMTRIPNTEILEIYEALRPGRSTYYQLLSLSQRIASQYGAEYTGAYVREAAEAYRDTGLLKMDGDAY